MQIEQAAMERLMPTLADRDVLDLACGTGRYGLLAQKTGARWVVGADNSRAMLRAGALRPLAEATMTDLPFAAQSFDVVICGLAVGHLPADGMRRTMSEIARILSPGGEALISDFHPFLSLRGGQRTFRTLDGTRYAVEHYAHLASDYYDAISAAGLSVSGMAEPRAEIDGVSVPAVFVVRCQR
jgi:ubiquinone/menaquinone biosynthesis C-methylase UbiE